MNNWFTADTHFGHANIIRFCNRPFSNPEDFDIDGKWINQDIKKKRAILMDETLISNWNSVVTNDDIVYHLGDFAFGQTSYIIKMLRRLKGQIRFIWGNHDDYLKQVSRIIHFYPDLQDRIKFLGDYAEINVNGQNITLCHYAMRVFNGSHRGDWQLWGHSHGSLEDDKNTRSFDVGVDCHNFFPISFDQVQKIMDKKEWKPIDHHGAKNFNK